MSQTAFSDEEIQNIYKLIGENVKHYRMQKGMSQLSLSQEMGYSSVSLVSAAELCNDGKHFNIEHLYKISKILEIPITQFFESTPSEPLSESNQ
ncbi:helix-turn-helix transcriptional regulator [Sulfuricurvum sp.]|uniref:helix-turn-helix domain-containing protein n=1 Tax=Sulfuricurvum sp. TaxID=2025608 RepID=UPI002E3671D7|nr:helix-turn-helix transcriptional regulator [Sulfuricurvum sp.]HEX5329729.1 helix-turn-helix transcriptional regulator [Sulfuricurvum sp.]